MRLYYIGLIFILYTTTIGYGQDIHFSQTIRSEFQVNPAFTGAFKGNLRATLNWKDQWQSVNNTFRTYAASAEGSFGKGRARKSTFFGVGGYAYRDVSGDVQLGNTTAGLTFSSLVKTSRNSRLSLGINGAYTSMGINPSAMQWGTQYDGINFDPSLYNGEGIEFQPFNYLDVSAGLAYWYVKNDRNVGAIAPYDAKIGLSVYHLNRPYYTFYNNLDNRMPMRFVFHSSAIFGTNNEDLFFYPNLTMALQGPQHEILVGSLWKYNISSGSRNTGFATETSIALGASMRITNVIDAITPQLFFNMYSLSVGLSYDINISRLNQASQYRGGFELSLRFTNPDHYTHRNPFRRAVSI